MTTPTQVLGDEARLVIHMLMCGFRANNWEGDAAYVRAERLLASIVPTVDVKDERAAFEAWARKQPAHVIKDLQRYDDDHPDKSRAGQYGHFDTANAWMIWQARAALAQHPTVDAEEFAELQSFLTEWHRDARPEFPKGLAAWALAALSNGGEPAIAEDAPAVPKLTNDI
jgi:hypothetical protein